MKRILTSAYLILLLLITATTVSAEDIGRAKADTCLGCHGVPSYSNVYPTYPVPKLAGQHKDYLVIALKAYQSGERKHKTMRAQASQLTDDDINIIAEYFSKLPTEASNPEVTVPADLEAHIGTCSACHGQDGNSPVPTFPKIAGQREDYLYQTLKGYKTGQRKNEIMLGMASILEDEDMKKLARFFASNPGLSTITLKRRIE